MSTQQSDRAEGLSPLKRAFLALEDAQARLAAMDNAAREPIAIIGIGCRIPGGADDPDAFWRLLQDGVDAIDVVPHDRWDIDALFDPNPDAPGRIATRNGGFLRRVDQFDPAFFGIAPREAQGMDPQQRLLLEVAWEALEHAGQAPDRLERSATGVYVGLTGSDYTYLQLKAEDPALIDAHFASGIAHSIASGRVSYLLGLQGPSLTIDTACSSSLVAVHLASQALRNRECQMALAGGVNLILSPDLYIALSRSRMLAPDGRCKTFDAAADGFARAEGCGVIVLKRLSDAQAAGDRILAVVRGSAVNQDGPSSSLTAPNGPAQEAVIREALARGGVSPHQVSYIEAHGTGTQLGDPLEVQALSAVFTEGRDPGRPLVLGSVKTNVGHLEGAAGITGLIKTVLALQHETIPAHLHFKTPSPHIAWDRALRVVTAAEPWAPIDGTRIAGVSAFGFSGTNAHVVLEQAPAVRALPAPGRPLHVLSLSARDAASLRELASRYLAALHDASDETLADACHTANTGRARFAHRATVTGTVGDIRQRLAALAEGRPAAGVRTGVVTRRDPPRIAFLFTGQGAQFPGMMRELYAHAPVFRAALDRCAAVLASHLERPLLEVIFPDGGQTTPLDETAYTQPALFAVEYALAALWRSWGVAPQVVMGHSVGEYVAACVAGVMTLEDGLRLIARRGALMQSLPAGGTMAAVFAPEDEVARVVASAGGDLAVAAINGPAQTAVSGSAALVEQVCRGFEDRGVRCQRLPVSHAFHSPLVDPILDAFEREVGKVRFSSPRLHVISNVTGRVAKADEMGDPHYWRRHVREAVRFSDGVKTLHALRPDCVVEIGPHPTLLTFVSATLGDEAPQLIASLRKKRGDWEQMLEALSTLYLAGADVDWSSLYPRADHHVVDLPRYPFQRERCWFQSKPATPARSRSQEHHEHPLLGSRLRVATESVIYESRVTVEAPAFVRDHRVLDHVIVPAAAFLDTLVTAGRKTLGRDAVSVENVTIQEAMVLDDNGAARSMQVVCSPAADGQLSATISSANEDEHAWVTHVAATIRMDEAPAAAGVTLNEARQRCIEPIECDEFYAGFERLGLAFGPGFRPIRRLWRGDAEALGEVSLAAELVPGSASCAIHPALLDGCIQVIAAALGDGGDPSLFLPIGIERFRLVGRPDSSVMSHVSVERGAGGESVRADVRFFRPGGELLGLVEGVRLRRVSHDVFARFGKQWLDAALYETQWSASARASADDVSASLDDAVRAAEQSVTGLREGAGLDAYDAFLPKFDALCAEYVEQTLQRLGWAPEAGELIDGGALSQRLDVAPRFRRLFDRLLAILAEAQVLVREPEGWRVRRPLRDTHPERAIAGLAAQCPDGAEAELEMTARVAGQLAEALRGDRDPMQLLFPDGSIADAERLYRDAPTARFFNGLVAEVAAAIATARSAGRTLRVLEVGGGTGGTTVRVAPRLPADGVEYTFTDVGPTFVARARTRFAAFPWMQFGTLDLERDPETQGFAPHQFDVVIASNVIHATSDLRRTLGRINRLLAPGGVLVMLEVTAPQRWFDLTVGITDGWWAFTDTALRPDYPTLSRGQWTDLLTECGFDARAILPADAEQQGCLALQSLFVASAGLVPPVTAHHWLILVDRRGAAAALADRLRARGDRCTIVHAGAAFDRSGDAYTIDPASPADYSRLLGDVQSAAPAVTGVVHAWSLDVADWQALSLPALKAAESGSTVSAMLVAQALVRESRVPRLVLLTSGGQQADAHDRLLSPVQAGVWGLAKTLALEHPELRCTAIDLEPGSEPGALSAVAAELDEAGGESQVAIRGGQRLVARLTRRRTPSGDGPRSEPFRVVPAAAGSIERFRNDPLVRRSPGSGEVEIAVEATGLNFKDVLNALGMYPGDPGPLGGECAGRVVAVGAGVTHLRPGDDVLAVAAGSFASHVVAPAAFVQKRPAGMSAEEGAAFPIAFLTAEFCLGHLARLRAGERILIHAAAGGVGMAAIRIAQRAGAEVFATAGSPWKRELLRAMGVAHVMDSRTADFAEAVLGETEGLGVDVILNSLSGDQIDASFRALARGGRFVEIGKRGIKSPQWVKALGQDHQYFIVDWGETAERDPALIGGMLERLMAESAAGVLAPLPRHVFALDEVDRAFRFMAQARHAGKIVVRHGSAAAPQIRRDGTYVVTGGLSGLGLSTARWLADRGAGRLVLLGRRGVTAEARPVLDILRAAGTAVIAESIDVSDGRGLAALLARVRSDGPPIRGVVHSAGALDDAGLLQQSAERFGRVFAAKTHGAYLLDTLTRPDPLDFFVMFSSAASVLGSAGQANHAAANAMLDLLARERRSRGLAGLSINWGAWREVGAAADRGIIDRLKAEGVGTLSPQEGLDALEHLMASDGAQAAVLSIEWQRYLKHAWRGAPSPFFADLTRLEISVRPPAASAPAPDDDLRQRALAAPEGRRRAIVTAFVTEKALRALGVDPARVVDPRTPLGDLGLDSLLAVELRNTLGRALGKTLPATLLFDYPTIEALTGYLVTDVLDLETPVAVPSAGAVGTANLVGSIEDLSDEEVDGLLAARTKGQG